MENRVNNEKENLKRHSKFNFVRRKRDGNSWQSYMIWFDSRSVGVVLLWDARCRETWKMELWITNDDMLHARTYSQPTQHDFQVENCLECIILFCLLFIFWLPSGWMTRAKFQSSHFILHFFSPSHLPKGFGIIQNGGSYSEYGRLKNRLTLLLLY